ncbi:MAG: hypothetical protein KGS61_00150 [Verrucomicrobia bacterium]|nr:hypothetical protein [Verrucomicrobiota bacterium]
MACCLLLTDPAPPDVERLKRAFRSLKSRTEADAVKLARDASGILVRNLSVEEAQVLRGALAAEQVPVAVVDTAQLPALPAPKAIRRAELQAEALAIYDLLGRAVPVAYGEIVLLAAGVVRRLGLTTRRTEQKTLTYAPIRGIHTKKVTDVRHQVEDLTDIRLDLVLRGAATRYQIDASTFLFKHCFDRPELDSTGKLALLVQLLAERAPQATLNRGATALREGQPAGAAYVSKAALDDESIWHLWRLPGSIR